MPFLTPQIPILIRDRDRLPFSVANVPSANAFKNRLDKHWTSQELRHNWEAELSGTGSRSRVEF